MGKGLGRFATRRAVPGPAFIDFHVHINPLHLLKPDVRASFASKQPQFERVQRYMQDAGAFLELLDEERVEQVNLINYVAPDVMGYPPEVNEWVAKYASADRKRLNPFGGFHPRYSKDPKRDIDALVSKYEVAGVKVHGPHSLFYPNDYLDGAPGLRLLYEACERERIPVMFHTGTSVFPGARNKYGDPIALDDVAVDFPKLRIVLAHAGRPLWMETAMFLARRHPNVYFDISSIPPERLLEYLPELERDSAKAIFGSDWPGPHVPGMRANADAINKLPLTTEARRRILVENARKLLTRK